MTRIDAFKNDLKNKRAVKIIAGIDNFDVENVKNVLMSAEKAKASAVDICADESIIELAKQITTIPLFVSSTIPSELARAVELGADAIEIGNFDQLYRKGMRISADEVLSIVESTLALIGKKEVFVSVTIPGHIDISEQIVLAKKLEELDVDLIQTEGSAVITPTSAGARGLLETAQVSLANTIELVRNTDIPIMSASGITPTTAKLFFAAGASAIGVGSCVNKLNSPIEMVAVIQSLMEVSSAVEENIYC